MGWCDYEGDAISDQEWGEADAESLDQSFDSPAEEIEDYDFRPGKEG